MIRLRTGWVVILFGFSLFGLLLPGGQWDGVARAHSGASGVVKQRMDAMTDVGRNMKAIAAMVKGESPFDAAKVKMSAQIIAGHARNIPDLFPKGTQHKPSEATAAVWRDWERFVAIAADLEEGAVSLARAAGTAGVASDIRQQLAVVGKNCKTCHESFRLKK